MIEILRQCILPATVLKYEHRQQRGIAFKHDWGVFYAAQNFVPIIDIDTPDAQHAEPSVTCSTKQEALAAIAEYARAKGLTVACALTKGGVHGYVLSVQGSPRTDVMNILRDLNVDPLYIKYSLRQNFWSDRWSPKPGRAEDPPFISVVFEHGPVLAESLRWLQVRNWYLHREFLGQAPIA